MTWLHIVYRLVEIVVFQQHGLVELNVRVQLNCTKTAGRLSGAKIGQQGETRQRSLRKILDKTDTRSGEDWKSSRATSGQTHNLLKGSKPDTQSCDGVHNLKGTYWEWLFQTRSLQRLQFWCFGRAF